MMLTMLVVVVVGAVLISLAGVNALSSPAVVAISVLLVVVVLLATNEAIGQLTERYSKRQK